VTPPVYGARTYTWPCHANNLAFVCICFALYSGCSPFTASRKLAALYSFDQDLSPTSPGTSLHRSQQLPASTAEVGTVSSTHPTRDPHGCPDSLLVQKQPWRRQLLRKGTSDSSGQTRVFCHGICIFALFTVSTPITKAYGFDVAQTTTVISSR
jgi:hypothetical protein